MKISAIVPCRNEKAHICEFLDSILCQELDPGWEFEILVADGASDDGTRDVLDRYAACNPAIRVLDNPGRIVSTGLNTAVAAATGDVIVRLDAHTSYARDYVRECVRALSDSGADSVGGPWVAESRGLVGAAIAGAFRSPFCNGGGKAHDPAYEGEVDTVYLGCWRPSVFERVGLFDPELVRNQDDEFHFRLRRSGGRIWQSPRIRSRYAPRRSLAGLFRQYVQYGFWKVAVIRKHRALASWRHLVPALFVGSLLLLAALFLLAWVLGWDVAAAIAAAALAVELGLYAIAGGAATLALARCLRPPALLVVPLAFAVYHFAYGAGFLMGLLSQGKSPAWGAALAKLFTALTR